MPSGEASEAWTRPPADAKEVWTRMPAAKDAWTRMASLAPLWSQRPATAPAGTIEATSPRIKGARIACEFGSTELGESLATLAAWVKDDDTRLLEVRGCRRFGEEESIAMTRSMQTLAKLTGHYCVPAEQLRISPKIGEAFAGVELRAMTHSGIEAFFKEPRSMELEGGAHELANRVRKVLTEESSLYVEVRFCSSMRVADRRLLAIFKCLASSVPRRRLRGQVRAGPENKVNFYSFDELQGAEMF